MIEKLIVSACELTSQHCMLVSKIASDYFAYYPQGHLTNFVQLISIITDNL